MTDENRYDFDQALDILARVLRVTPLEDEAKFGYFKALKQHSVEGFVQGMNKVAQTFRPRRKDDFPVPAVISEAITGVVNAHADTFQETRSYPEIRESFRRRGILIGDEARERLEAEIDRKRQEADESWQESEEPVLDREPF
jgi:hypothetical protein